jgi:hypothetical protein
MYGSPAVGRLVGRLTDLEPLFKSKAAVKIEIATDSSCS